MFLTPPINMWGNSQFHLPKLPNSNALRQGQCLCGDIDIDIGLDSVGSFFNCNHRVCFIALITGLLGIDIITCIPRCSMYGVTLP